MAAIVAAVIGLFVGAAIWNLARRQAARIRLFGDPAISPGDWLPFAGFGTHPLDPITRERRTIWQSVFEVAVAAYFGAIGWKFGFSADLFMIILFSLPLLLIGLVDFWTRLIHTKVIYVGIALGIAFAATDGLGSVFDSLLGMALATGVFIFFFALAILIYRNINVVPFGLGDVYLAAMIGAMVGIDLVLQALVLGIFLAGVILGALLVARILSRKQAVAYGPYLCLGALLTMLIS
jgi:leader peptidase (prepilin peptidase) / N-methyltransferase